MLVLRPQMPTRGRSALGSILEQLPLCLSFMVIGVGWIDGFDGIIWNGDNSKRTQHDTVMLVFPWLRKRKEQPIGILVSGFSSVQLFLNIHSFYGLHSTGTVSSQHPRSRRYEDVASMLRGNRACRTYYEDATRINQSIIYLLRITLKNNKTNM